MMMTLWKYSCGRRKAGIEEFGRWLPTLPFIPGATFYPLLLRVPSLILTLLLFIQLLNSILGMRLPHLVLQLLTNGSIKKFWQRVTFATFTKLVAFSTPKTDRICHFFALCHIFAQILVWRKPKRKIWASNKMLIVLNESNTVVINMAWIGIFLILIIMRLIGRLMS